jgi:hypothetical protein
MMNKYDWKSISDRYYFYKTDTGKIVGHAGKVALQEIFYGVVYTGDFTFTVADEGHLGQYVSLEHAKKAIEFHWEVQNKTLLENHS